MIKVRIKRSYATIGVGMNLINDDIEEARDYLNKAEKELDPKKNSIRI